jgi:hypothetical protein
MSERIIPGEAPSDVEVRRWVAEIGRTHVGSFMRFASAIWSSARAHDDRAPRPEGVWSLYRRMRRAALRDPIDLGSLAADGDDLRRAGIPTGPALGKILQALLTAVIEDPSRNRTDWLLQEARRLHEQQRPETGQGGRS